MNLKLRNKNYCDSCEKLKELNTIGGHKRCEIYNKIMLSNENTFIASKGMGHILRLDICKKENNIRESK